MSQLCKLHGPNAGKASRCSTSMVRYGRVSERSVAATAVCEHIGANRKFTGLPSRVINEYPNEVRYSASSGTLEGARKPT